MISLLIDVQDVLGKGIPGDTVTVEAPAARPAEDGGVVRPFRRIIELDDEGRATIEVEPGPIVVIFHDEVDRQIVVRGIVPRDREVVTLRELIVAEIGTVDDVPGIRDALGGKADKDHRHQIADVDDLADTLDGKAAADHRHQIADVDDLADTLETIGKDLDGKAPGSVAVELAGKADKEHWHEIGDVAGLITALDAAITQDELSAVEASIDLKADKNHRHTINDVDDLRWSLDQKLNRADFRTEINDIAGQRIAELVDGAPESLDTLREVADELANQDETIAALFTEIGKRAMAKHTHAIADVNGLASALDGKASTSHVHQLADVNGLDAALEGKANAASVSRVVDNVAPVLFIRRQDTWQILGSVPSTWNSWSLGRLYPDPGYYLVVTIGGISVTGRSDTASAVNFQLDKPLAVYRIDKGGYFLLQGATNGDALVVFPIARTLS